MILCGRCERARLCWSGAPGPRSRWNRPRWNRPRCALDGAADGEFCINNDEFLIKMMNSVFEMTNLGRPGGVGGVSLVLHKWYNRLAERRRAFYNVKRRLLHPKWRFYAKKMMILWQKRSSPTATCSAMAVGASTGEQSDKRYHINRLFWFFCDLLLILYWCYIDVLLKMKIDDCTMWLHNSIGYSSADVWGHIAPMFHLVDSQVRRMMSC